MKDRSSWEFLIPFIPHGMEPHFTRWMIVEQKQTFGKFDVFWTTLEDGHLINSEIDAPSLTGIYCMWGTDCNNTSVILLLSGETIGLWLGVSMGSYSIYGVNQVSLRSIFSDAPLCEMRCKIFVQFGGIVPSLMNKAVKISSSNTTWNWGETWPVYGFRTRATDSAWNDECPS